MADDLRRFVTDLRALRESRGVSLQRIQSDTRIPIDVLRQFEETGLEGNRVYNRVYLRSLVRVYSQSIGVPVEPVLRSLDGAFEGRYTGIGVEAPPAEAPPAEAPPAEAPPAEAPPEPPAADPAVAPAPRRGHKKAEAAPEPLPAADEAAVPDAPAPADPAAEPEGRRVVELPQAYDGGRVFDTVPAKPGLPSWAYGVLALLALGALAAGVIWWMGRAPAQTVADDALSQEDTTAAPDTSAAPASTLPATLPAYIRLTVRATGAALAPFRLTIDQDVRRPYWLNADSAQVYTFKDSVVVAELTPTAELLVEGVKVADTFRQPDGSYRLRRADLQGR